jgi:hypothetical protein
MSKARINSALFLIPIDAGAPFDYTRNVIENLIDNRSLLRALF